MKSINEDETEICVRLLLGIFQLDPRNQAYFSLGLKYLKSLKIFKRSKILK